MSKKPLVIFLSTFSILLFTVTPLCAQTANSSATIYYSPDQYPTAQGKYLQLPGSYQLKATATAEPVSPVALPVTPPRYVAPPPPVLSSSSRIDMPPMQPVIVYPQPTGTSAGPVPSHVPAKASVAHSVSTEPQGISLGTITGIELGFQASDYRYQEHVVANPEFIHISGATYGVTIDGSKSFDDGWFAGGELRLAYGSHDYTGGDVDLMTQQVTPATKKGIGDSMLDIRVLGGHDYLFRDSFGGLTDVGVSPYAGLGFRYLIDNNTGQDSNGVATYRRYSHYVYLPLGVTPRIRLTDNSRLSLNTEFDVLIGGWQTSKLGDTFPGTDDVTNSQNEGYALRGSLMYEWQSWSTGPFFEFWNINESTTDCVDVTGLGSKCFNEPHNQTLEYGVQIHYRF